MSAELTDQERTFVEWHATPRGSRNPGSFKALCKYLDISEPTGYRWLKRANIEQAIADLVKQAVGGADRVMMVVDALFESATTPQGKFLTRDVRAAEVFLKYAGVLNDRPAVAQKSDIEEMSEEQLAAAAEAIAIRHARTMLKK